MESKPLQRTDGAPQASAPETIYQGNVDALQRENGQLTLRGWVKAVASDRPVDVVAFLGERRVGKAVADRFREDLRAAGIGDGEHAFAIALEPEALLDRDQLLVRCNGEFLLEAGNCPFLDVVPGAGPPEPRAQSAKSEFRGAVDALRRAAGELVVLGWVAKAGERGPLEVLVMKNDVELARAIAEVYRGDLDVAGVGTGRHGFELRISDEHVNSLAEIAVVTSEGFRMSLEHLSIEEEAPLQESQDRGSPGDLVVNLDHARVEGGAIVIAGWAWDRLFPDRHVELSVLLGSECLGMAIACDRRADLVQAHIGSGEYGFTLRLPLSAEPSLQRLVIVVDRSLRVPLSSLSLGPPAEARPISRVSLLDPPSIDGDKVRLTGWSFETSLHSVKSRIEARLGPASAHAFALYHREDVAQWGVHDGSCGFVIELPIPSGMADLGGLELVHVDGDPLTPAPCLADFEAPHWPPAAQSSADIVAGFMVRQGVLRGWAARVGSFEPIGITVEFDGKRVWRGVADRIEEIEVSGKKRKAARGFRVELPEPRSGHVIQRVSVLADDGRHLPGSPLTFTHGGDYDGKVEHVVLRGNGAAAVSGWCVNRRRPSEAVPIRVTDHRGREILTGVADRRRPDLATIGLDSPFGGFCIEVPAAQARAGILVWPANARCVLRNLPSVAEDLVRLDRPPTPPAASFVRVHDTVKGTVDEVSHDSIRGWARCETDPTRMVFVDLFVDDVLVATTAARRYRRDLAEHFHDHGCHEYLFELSSPMVWQRPGKVVVRPRRGVGQIGAPKSLPIRSIVQSEVSRAARAFVFDRFRYAAAADSPASSLISCIILNLDGANLLRVLFESFAAHNTQPVEIIVVDHGSTDASAAVCEEWSRSLAIRFFNRGANFSFSASNNFGARQASGELLLFLNNDVRLCSDILPGVVAKFRDSTLGALGIKLLDDTPLPGDDPAQALPGDNAREIFSIRTGTHAIQHLGVHLNLRSGPFALLAFESRYSAAWRSATSIPVEVPVVTGAFLACRRGEFEDIGGFDERYYYGYEDVDLCLKVREAGKRVVCANDLAALHLRAYSRVMMDKRYDGARVRNLKTLDERFGLQVRRSLALDRFARPGFWTNALPRVAFVVTSTDPNTMAGDYFTALELADALAAEFPVRCFFVTHGSPEVADLRGVDVVVGMRDDFDPGAVKKHDPHLLKVAWVRNWFSRFADRPFADRFHLVWASSACAADFLREELGRDVEVVPIATNPHRFGRGERRGEFECDYCFTGSYWGLNREIVQMLEPGALPYDFAIFGDGWSKVPSLAPYARGPVPYGRMPDVYASTKLVVDDANHATKSHASVNSRVFDAIAAGALVITNGRAGADEQFGGELPTYETPQELEDHLRTYLSDDGLRSAKVKELQKIVFSRHTYQERARRVWKSIAAASGARRVAIKIGAPRRAVREEWGDYHFARGMQYALERLGYLVRIDCMEEWESAGANADDVVVVLRGLTQYKTRPDQINIMWLISHPDTVSASELMKFDHVFVASDSYASSLRSLLEEKVSPLLQCTDERYFNPDVGSIRRQPCVIFVGNSREQFRPVVRDALEAGLDLHVYGSRWSGFIPESFIKGEHIPNKELAIAYRNAAAVLNDHWDSMRAHGFISNRIFDAVASGARIVSDRIDGLAAVFGDLVREYGGADQLRRICDGLAGESDSDQARRDDHARELLTRHSFHARMGRMVSVIEQLFEERSATRSLYGAEGNVCQAFES